MDVISEIVKFKPGEPQLFTLAFAEPKACQSRINGEDQFMVSSTDGRKGFIPPYAAKKLADTGAGRGDTVQILKTWRKEGTRNVPDWVVEVVQEPAARDASTEVAAPAPATNNTAASATTSVSRPETQLDDALMTAILACKRSEAFAAAQGYPLKWDKDDVRSLAVTVLIGMQGQRRSA